MNVERISIGDIPALVWGAPSEKVYLCVHGKMSCKESAEGLAAIAAEKGVQTISFDLPQHGERQGETRRCDIWNGVQDLTAVADAVYARWREVNLYACSLGAFFSLHALADRPLGNCLFQSPIVDMDHLVQKMMLWFDITPERLEREREIDTPIDLLSWDYWQYVLQHPIRRWPWKTSILYAGQDDLQSREVMEAFAGRHGCHLTISEQSQHTFMDAADGPVVEAWLRQRL